jgi:hypothetical protein
VNTDSSNYAAWYTYLLGQRVNQFSKSPLSNAVKPLILRQASMLEPTAENTIRIISQALSIIATELASGNASIDSIAQRLIHEDNHDNILSLVI